MLKIKGGKRLKGKIRIPGDKITSVHVLFASLFVDRPIKIENFQYCGDSIRIIDWLVHSGLKTIRRRGRYLTLYPTDCRKTNLEKIVESRASICVVSALVFQNRLNKFSHPGGCGFSFRAIDRHLDWFNAIGMRVSKQHDYFTIKKNKIPNEINFRCSTKFGPSVGVTCQALMFSLAFDGEIILSDVALEPVIMTLIELLKKQGKRVVINKSFRQITIYKGFRDSPPTYIEISIPPDQTAAFTFIAAAISTRSKISLINIKILSSIKNLLDKMNIKISNRKNMIRVDASQPKHPGKVICDVWPAVPSDIGPIICGALTNIQGQTIFHDKVYIKRNSHLSELGKLGGSGMEFQQGYVFKVENYKTMRPARLKATDIRSGAAVLVAALGSNQTVYIQNEKQIIRGYENLCEQF